jgi:cytochrome c-type biogenesis protein CcmH
VCSSDLEGKPEQVIAQALKLDPNDLQSLWLAGTAAFNRKDFPAALKHWEQALKQIPPESEDAQMLSGIVAEARQKMGTQKSAVTTAIAGRVDIAAAHRNKVVPTDTIFILARVADSPMPLAVKRMRAGDLPAEFRLDDTDAIPGGAALSGAKSVIVEARVSKSGDARQKPGDLLGSVAQVKPGARNLKVTIDKVIE